MIEGYKIISEKYTVTNPMGLDLRCVRMLVQTAQQFEAEVEVNYHRKRADGKSLLDMLALGVSCGETVEVRAYGHEAQQTQRAIQNLFTHAFGADVLSVIADVVMA